MSWSSSRPLILYRNTREIKFLFIIGLIICKNKNNIVAEYALNNINHPMGITEYELTKIFPEEFKSSLPTIEEIENELNNER